MSIDRRLVLGLSVLAIVVASLGARWYSDSLASRGSGLGLGYLDDPKSPLFPVFTANRTIEVVDATDNSTERRLIASTLQGIVNRVRGEIYLRLGRAIDTRILDLIVAKYGVTTRNVTLEDMLLKHAPTLGGVILYDPDRPESVNIGTMYASLLGCIVAHPADATWLRDDFGIQVRLDLRTALPEGKSRGELYELALTDLQKHQSVRSIAIMEPEMVLHRDYIIAIGAFPFYLQQGILADPQDSLSTDQILERTPHGIPVLGWFPTPTMTEENLFIQKVSRTGKHMLGSTEVPNLSLLAGLRPSEPLAQRRPPAPVLEEGDVYISFTISDGDNLGFMAYRMIELWDRRPPDVELGWSVSPALAEIAPALLHLFYSEAENDTFIAGPSGAGYMYPSFYPPSEIGWFAGRTAWLMQQTDLRTLWLLNSFLTYEIEYPRHVMTAFADAGLGGIALDYADAPVSIDRWMQGGESRAAPVIRSTHLWSTLENLVEKVDARITASGDRSNFVFVTINPWTRSAEDVPEIMRILDSRHPGRMNVVAPDHLFELMTDQFLRDGPRALDVIAANPLTYLSPLDRQAAQRLGADAAITNSFGDRSAAAFQMAEAHRAANRAAVHGAGVAAALVGIGLIGLLVSSVRGTGAAKRPRRGSDSERSVRPLTIGVWRSRSAIILSTALFLTSLARVADLYLVDYASLFAAAVLAFWAGDLEKALHRRLSGTGTVSVALVMQACGAALLWSSSVFIVPAAVGLVLVIGGTRRAVTVAGSEDGARSDRSPALPPVDHALTVVTAFSLSVALVALLPIVSFVPLILAALAAPVAALLAHAKSDPPPDGSVKGLSGIGRYSTTGALLLSLTLAPLLLVSNPYISVRLGAEPDSARMLAGSVSLVAGALGIGLYRAIASRRHAIGLGRGWVDAAVLVATCSSIAFAALLVVGGGPFQLVSLFIAAGLAVVVFPILVNISPISDPRRTIREAVILLSAGYLLLRLPPISFSLYVVRLESVGESALYGPPLLVIGVIVLIIAGIVLARPKNATRNPGD